MRFQSIYDIAALCSLKGIDQAILCPGSRCAPLTLAFARHPNIRTRTISDERSAGYIALGIAQSLRKPVVVVSTSGTAAYNLAPAIAEAYFSETPLIVLTADRPSEWVAQNDGQTIFQYGIYGKHVKRSFQLPEDYDYDDSRWAINRIVNDAINLARQSPQGPVHINAPFREPLYPAGDEATKFSEEIRVIESPVRVPQLSDAARELIRERWPSFRHILIVAGQQDLNERLTVALNALTHRHHIRVIADIFSNLQGVNNRVRHADLFLGQLSAEAKDKLRPDLLITFGQSIVSKNVKLFLRQFPPMAHWHIQEGGDTADTFQHLTAIFHATPEDFIDAVKDFPTHDEARKYGEQWSALDADTFATAHGFLERRSISELDVVWRILKRIPDGCDLHLANSMSVRYANFLGLDSALGSVRVHSNRGTSGIDGCTSTAVGHHLASGRPTFLITGDMAFFYDRNAFWHNYPLPDFRVVVLNNHGGLIFNLIDGPASVPEAAEYFVTRQRLGARKLCEEYGFEHLHAVNRSQLNPLLDSFFTFDGRTKILEYESDLEVNGAIFGELKQAIRQQYGS